MQQYKNMDRFNDNAILKQLIFKSNKLIKKTILVSKKTKQIFNKFYRDNGFLIIFIVIKQTKREWQERGRT